MQNLIIRNESRADHAAISHVIEQAFKDQQYSSHTEQFIVNALRDAQQLTIALVAVLNQEIEAYCDFSSQHFFSCRRLVWLRSYRRFARMATPRHRFSTNECGIKAIGSHGCSGLRSFR